jgi:DNA transformation protein
MAVSPAARARIEQALSQIVPVRIRPMFGGAGIYAGDLFFALIGSDDTLYLKTDDANRTLYTDAGAQQFMNMPYYSVPEHIFADPAELAEWTVQALGAAERGREAKRSRR